MRSPRSHRPPRPRASVLAVLAALALLAGLVATPAPAPAAAVWPRAAAVYETQAHDATNQKRGARDLRVLGRNACLTKMARLQATRMARQGRIFHQDLGAVQRRCKVGWVGENVAYGYPNGRAVVNAWMGSSGHRANILRRQFRQEGIGAVRAEGRWYVAQVFGTPA